MRAIHLYKQFIPITRLATAVKEILVRISRSSLVILSISLLVARELELRLVAQGAASRPSEVVTRPVEHRLQGSWTADFLMENLLTLGTATHAVSQTQGQETYTLIASFPGLCDKWNDRACAGVALIVGECGQNWEDRRNYCGEV
ncbi:hypothetical protein RRG08_024135 [Elysia crispata]|uniref:Uncharacterized protein n=1 Tax=Elysia crispata TaxID=231223 RepID=A0AAE0YQ86_9GAST|nr:hypothetical protein RRG08_024135 [Elysia crispata]